MKNVKQSVGISICIITVFIAVIVAVIIVQQISFAESPEEMEPFAVRTVSLGDSTQENEGAYIDYSNVNDGYFMAKYTGDKLYAALSIEKEGDPEGKMDVYYLTEVNEYAAFPLYSDGNYTVKFYGYEREEDISTDDLLIKVELSVVFNEGVDPWLLPSVKCPFDENSQTTLRAKAIVEESKSEKDAAIKIANYVTDNLEYDLETAEGDPISRHRYISPDEALLIGKATCGEFASITAAMLRSQGIPAKIIYGFPTKDFGNFDTYHAWNEAYVDGQWVRIDTVNKPFFPGMNTLLPLKGYSPLITY